MIGIKLNKYKLYVYQLYSLIKIIPNGHRLQTYASQTDYYYSTCGAYLGTRKRLLDVAFIYEYIYNRFRERFLSNLRDTAEPNIPASGMLSYSFFINAQNLFQNYQITYPCNFRKILFGTAV